MTDSQGPAGPPPPPGSAPPPPPGRPPGQAPGAAPVAPPANASPPWPAPGPGSGAGSVPPGWGQAPAAKRGRSGRGLALAALLVVVVGGGTLATVAALSGRGGPPGGAALASPSPTTTAAPRSPTPEPGASAERIDTPATPSPTPFTGDTYRIGVVLPLTGGQRVTTDAVRAAVELAIADANAQGHLDNVRYEAVVLDHGDGEWANNEQARQDLEALIEDPSVVGVVGPYYDDTAAELIPVAVRDGLAMCSPTNITWNLTRGEKAAKLQPDPDHRAYFRVNAPVDRVGEAMAEVLVRDERRTRAVVVDDGTPEGRAMVEEFTQRFETLGGRIVDTFTTAGGVAFVDLQEAAKPNVDAVFFGGWDSKDALAIRAHLDDAGLQDRPLLAGPVVSQDDVTAEGGFVHDLLARPGRPGNVIAGDPVRSEFPQSDAFWNRMVNEAGIEPGWYGDAGFVCAQTLLQAIEAAAADGEVTREAVRAAATTPDQPIDTLWGRISYDARGDVKPTAFTVWRLDRNLDEKWRWDGQRTLAVED